MSTTTTTAARATATASLWLVLAASGCGNQADTSGDEPDPPQRSDRGAEAGKAPPPPATKNWDISSTAPGPVTVGAEGQVQVKLTGRNGYHVNQEYPIALTLQSPEGARLTKTKLVREDARPFEEAQAVFPVVVVPESAGRKTIRGELDFSVCNPQTCLLERQPVSVDVDAVASAGSPSPP